MVSGARVIEFEAAGSFDHEGGRGLQFIGEHNDGTAGQKDDSMEEGNSNDAEEAVEYDYYKIYRGSTTESINHWNSELELRFATEEEQSFLLGNSDSESDCAADDDDDSNDENNWRNDYPEDDDADDTEDDDFDYNSDIRYPRVHFGNENDEFELDRMRRHLEMFEVDEYEGEEDTSDDDPVVVMRRCF